MSGTNQHNAESIKNLIYGIRRRRTPPTRLCQARRFVAALYAGWVGWRIIFWLCAISCKLVLTLLVGPKESPQYL